MEEEIIMAAGLQKTFCPHITFRQSFRHKRASEKNHLSEEDISVIINSSSNITNGKSDGGVIADASSPSSSTTKRYAVNHEGSGEPADLVVVPERKKLRHSFGSSVSTVRETICQQCDPSENATSGRPSNHLWRCLEPKCKLVLCGKQGKNHSQYHYQEFPTHCLQENAANKRIWCNDCNMEVFPDHRNRRPAPAVWVPHGTEDEPPRGLFNIGNTCFMNAALQCMAGVRPLTSFILGQSCGLKGKNVASSYLWFLSEMWAKDSSGYSKGVMPSRLLHAVRAAHPIFRGFQQHDTQEFLRLFMDTLAEETRIPHFSLVDVDQDRSDSSSDDGTMSLDSETESFETCDSGNASEETMSTDVQPENAEDAKKALKEVKISMKSIVSEIFDGQVESSAQCLSCKQVSSRLEVFQDLSLPIPTRDELMSIRTADRYDTDDGKTHQGWAGWILEWLKSFFWGPSPSLEDCFAAFFSSDELKGKNMYSCEKCRKLRNGVKRCTLYRLPEILCVHLKRFRMYEYSGGMGFSGKVSQYVQFPLEGLDLSPFLNKDCPNQVTTYRLLGAICHIGSFLGGHYTAYIRRDDEWYLCDDARVVAVSPETVAECEAYVLFYQKYDLQEDASKPKQEVFDCWETADGTDSSKDMKFHLLSRKWLTHFIWGEEPGPIDNSDIICPHGYISPYENVNYGATWVPDTVWNSLVDRFGGGPDLKHSEECVICLAAWKKQTKSSHPERDRNPRALDNL